MATTTTGVPSTTTSTTSTPSPTSTTSSSTTPSPTSTTASPTSTTTPPSTTPGTPTSTTNNITSTTSTTTSTTASAVVTTPNTSHTSLTTPTTGIPAVVTQLSTTFISASETPTASGSTVRSSASHGFFANKGAVAGVFTVVGLIGLVIIIALITNAVRRRRARKFDKELIAATREAAATAPNPIFLDDEEDPEDRFKRSNYGMGYGSGGSNGYHSGNSGPYSDGSHGTYGQPPMEAYNMRDMGGHGTGIGEIYDPYAAGGAAGIGVARARSMRVDPANASPNTYAAALQEGGNPYPKFAIGPHDTYGGGGAGGGTPFVRGANTNLELLEAAGMGAHVAGAGMISHGQQQQQYQQGSHEYANLGGSVATTTQPLPPSPSSTPSQLHSLYPQQPYPARQMSPQQSSLASSAYLTAPVSSGLSDNLPNPYDPKASGRVAEVVEDAYGGYVVEDPTIHSEAVAHEHPQVSNAKHIPNPFLRESISPEGEYRRYKDEVEEKEVPKRVLKVANE